MPELACHILIVDDEPAIQSMVKRYFEKRGAQVHCAGSGDEMHVLLQQHPVKLVFLDVHLPGKNGFELLHEIKQTHSAGIIMLTARNELDDRIAGLEGGADDYVPKPFEVTELLARANAVLRRLDHQTESSAPETSRYCFAGYCLDCKVRQLIDADRQTVELSPAEFDLLKVFVQHPETVLSRDYLMQQTRGRDAGPFDRTIDVRVGQLRKKLPANDLQEPLFKTIRGGGYMLTEQVTRHTLTEKPDHP
ncbi:MAG: response regulator transcription factor [Thiolinea sp.]